MKLADKITFLRLIFAPVFFVLFIRPGMNGSFFDSLWYLAVLWFIFLVVEASDLIDGRIARLRNEESDFGRLFDPFADVMVRVTYFLCFVIMGILPVIPFLVILYREFGILFLRILMMKKGIAMGARTGGKLKSTAYMLTGLLCLVSFSIERLGFRDMVPYFNLAAIILFILSMALALVSFVDYLIIYFKA